MGTHIRSNKLLLHCRCSSDIKWIFFFHPADDRYRASPDGIGQNYLLEVKTRALNSCALLNNVTGPHIIQSNFQMACTGGKVTFLESYLPEQNIANAFFVKCDNLVIDIL